MEWCPPCLPTPPKHLPQHPHHYCLLRGLAQNFTLTWWIYLAADEQKIHLHRGDLCLSHSKNCTTSSPHIADLGFVLLFFLEELFGDFSSSNSLTCSLLGKLKLRSVSYSIDIKIVFSVLIIILCVV